MKNLFVNYSGENWKSSSIFQCPENNFFHNWKLQQDWNKWINEIFIFMLLAYYKDWIAYYKS